MKLLLIAVALCLAGCTTPTQSRGNVSTYSGNGNGNQTEQVLRACADAVVEILRKHPEQDGDALFRKCYLQNGVQFI